MPNASTRRRRRKAGLPTYCTRLASGNGELVLTRLPRNAQCRSRYLALGNCSPYALMSWLSRYIWPDDDIRGWRLGPPHEKFTVWVFKTCDDADRARTRFYDSEKVLPFWVPPNMELTLHQIHHEQLF